jgi:hypothetical protein
MDKTDHAGNKKLDLELKGPRLLVPKVPLDHKVIINSVIPLESIENRYQTHH